MKSPKNIMQFTINWK